MMPQVIAGAGYYQHCGAGLPAPSRRSASVISLRPWLAPAGNTPT